MLQQQLAKVPSLVEKYDGQYPKMWRILEKKYVVKGKGKSATPVKVGGAKAGGAAAGAQAVGGVPPAKGGTSNFSMLLLVAFFIVVAFYMNSGGTKAIGAPEL